MIACPEAELRCISFFFSMFDHNRTILESDPVPMRAQSIAPCYFVPFFQSICLPIWHKLEFFLSSSLFASKIPISIMQGCQNLDYLSPATVQICVQSKKKKKQGTD